MANPEEHLIMSNWYYQRAEAYFKKAEALEQLSDKAGYFALSSQCLLASTDHLLGWFTRSDEFTGRKGRKNYFMNYPKIKKLSYTEKKKFWQFFDDVED
ncbi:MAG: hypothetical protein ACE5KT_04290 [Methanosarcinales archaeon]